jgi:hypothetical protein
MTLPDQNSCMMNALGKAKLKDLRLQATLQEVLNLKSKHVIKTHARLVEHANAHKSTNECIAFKQSLRVLVIELEQLTRSTSDF